MEVFSNLVFDKEFTIMTKEEIIIIRQIINNMANRKFFLGLNLLATNLTFSCLMLEGRIWKSIILNFSEDQIL